MTAPDRVRIDPLWDSTLAYESLYHGGDEPGRNFAFVGRQDLLGPLVSAIQEPEKRGTILLSGYRGAGKTTLLIRSLLLSRDKLRENKWLLFPLVLNVSEISASLDCEKPGEASLVIDPRRLLTAMLRSLQQRLEAPDRTEAHGSDKDWKELERLIRRTYAKATAAEYKQSFDWRREREESIISERSTTLTVADVYRLIGGGTAASAAALEVSLWSGRLSFLLHGMAIALAGTSALSWTHSSKLARRRTEDSSGAVSLRFDNSLQQLEADLKQVLARLWKLNARVVVILEELDKIDDNQGKQLDAIIRYFKNLFTQAPALFFFLTDKQYFDLVESRIKNARRDRNYAIEHTFFTHRLFVDRPTTENCLDYLAFVLSDKEARDEIASIKSGQSAAVRPLKGMNRFEMLVRVLLYRSANHLFDLKNEIRSYVATRERDVTLEFDAESFPDDEAWLAAFHSLIEAKHHSYRFTDARPYANETLRDCLYAVFADVGSPRPQEIARMHPNGSAGSRDPAQQGLVGIDSGEAKRIETAVLSLIADLQRGGAFLPSPSPSEFLWKPDAVKAFSFVRALQTHELEFQSELMRWKNEATPFGTNGALAGLGKPPAEADALVADVEQRAKSILETPVPLELVQLEKPKWQERVGELVGSAYQAQRLALSNQGFQVQEFRPATFGSGLHLLVPKLTGDPRFSAAPRKGAVVFVQGEPERMAEDFLDFIGSVTNLERLSIVHIGYPEPKTSGFWSPIESLLLQKLPGLTVTFNSSKLADASATANPRLVRDELAREILFRGFWATRPVAAGPLPLGLIGPALTLSLGAQDQPVQDFKEGLELWLKSAHRILWSDTSVGDAVELSLLPATAASSPTFKEFAVISADFRGNFSQRPTAELGEAMRSEIASPPVLDNFEVYLDRMIVPLLQSHRLIPIISFDATPNTELPALKAARLLRLLGQEGRAIVIAPSYPVELQRIDAARIGHPLVSAASA